MVKAQTYLKAGKARKSEVWATSMNRPDTPEGLPLFVKNLTAHQRLHAEDETR